MGWQTPPTVGYNSINYNFASATKFIFIAILIQTKFVLKSVSSIIKCIDLNSFKFSHIIVL